MTLDNKRNYLTRCNYCRKPFRKRHNKEICWLNKCKKNALMEQKARHQTKMRLRLKQKILVVDEYEKYGLGNYGTSAKGHRKKKFTQEHIAI